MSPTAPQAAGFLLSGLLVLCHAARAQDACSAYAKRAVEQYQLMVSHPNCRVAPGLRWAPSFQNHYNGCKVLPDALLRHEESERDKWLQACGAIVPPDPAAANSPKDAASALAQMMATPAEPVDPAQIPAGLVMCEAGQCEAGNQGTWIFRGTNGVATWPKGQKAKLTILRFDAKDILIRREDAPTSVSPGFVALYSGTRVGDRVDGKIESAWPGHFPNAKPPGVAVFQYYATIPQTTCAAGNELVDPMEVAQTAVRFRQQKSAFACYQIAANQNNAQSKGILALMYRDGIGTEPDKQQAFHWAELGANQQDYNSELMLAEMYENGVGTVADASKAQAWRERAQKNPVVLQAQAQAQAQANMQKMALMGMAALVEAMSRPDYVILER